MTTREAATITLVSEFLLIIAADKAETVSEEACGLPQSMAPAVTSGLIMPALLKTGVGASLNKPPPC